MTSANKNDVLGDGKVSYTLAEGTTPATLTLNGANISTGHVQTSSNTAGIDYSGTANLNIVLSGTNTVKNDTAALTSGIYSSNISADIAVSGNGTLTVSGSYFGIISGNSITVSSGTVTARSGESGDGINAMKEVIIEGGTVNASGKPPICPMWTQNRFCAYTTVCDTLC